MKPPSTAKATPLGKIALVWAIVFLSLYVLLESLFFCCTSYLFPYAVRTSFGFGIYPLLQTSKNSTTPENYVAIFGDSYGFGAGDHFSATQHQINPKFNVTHILHDRTGRDFVSFALPNSSPLCGWVEDPVSSMNYINATLLHHIEKPKEILLYFYEGNDIQDVYIDLQARYTANGYDKGKINDTDYFSNFIHTEMLEKNQINISSKNFDISNNLFLASYVMNAAKEKREWETAKSYIQQLKPPQPGINNRISIDGKNIPLPDNMAAPPVEMAPEKITDSLDFINAIAHYTKLEYPEAKIGIIYIPSSIMSYRIVSETISFYNPEGNSIVRTRDAIDLSNSLCSSLYGIAKANGLGFYDTRAGIQAKGMKAILHGPFDLGHFNEAGYHALADEISGYLNSPPDQKQSPCAQL